MLHTVPIHGTHNSYATYYAEFRRFTVNVNLVSFLTQGISHLAREADLRTTPAYTVYPHCLWGVVGGNLPLLRHSGILREKLRGGGNQI